MPYQVFCVTNWNSSCVLLSQKEGTFTLQFSATAPFVGGMVEYTIIPIELKKAYQKDAAMIATLNRALGKLERGIYLQKTEEFQNLKYQVKSWSDYHNRIVAVIDEIEKSGGCSNSKLDTLRNAL
jgi:hypothetical protein